MVVLPIVFDGAFEIFWWHFHDGVTMVTSYATDRA